MLRNTIFPNPAKPDLNVQLPIDNRAKALDFIGNGFITQAQFRLIKLAIM